MNRQEAAIVSAYTGVLLSSFEDMHLYVEEVMGRPVMTHEFAIPECWDAIKRAVKPDFVAIADNLTDN